MDYEGITKHLWYIIPGGILVIPLLLINKINVFDDSNLGILILISFILGYVLHQIYRLIYNEFFFYNPSNKFKQFIKDKLKKHILDISKEDIDNIYNYFIYSDKYYRPKTESIRKESFFLTSIGTVFITIFIVFLIILIYNEHFIILILLILLFLFGISWYLLYKKMVDYQKFLFSDFLYRKCNNLRPNTYNKIDHIKKILDEKNNL